MPSIQLSAKRQVKHLTLLRQGRPIAVQEYNALARSERLSMIRQAHGRQKLSLILAAADADLLVPQLASQELYLLTRELGGEEMGELLALTTTAQITTLLDLDIWDGDEIDPARILVWLNLLLETGPDKVLQTASELEPELLTLLVGRFVQVVRGPEAYDNDDAENAARQEGLYDLEYADAESAKVLAQLLDILYREENPLYLRLMESLRAETPTVLQEQEYQFRRGRLLDHGFADPAEAMRVYAWLDPHSFDPARRPKRTVETPEPALPPAYLLPAANPADLLDEVLAAGVDNETVWEFSLLLNRVLAAERIDIGEAAAVQQALLRVHGLLNLGLEHLAEGQADRAMELFGQCYLQDLFRVGFSLTLELRHWAVKLLQSPVAGWLDAPFRCLLDALAQPRPQLWQGLLRQPQDAVRDFSSRRDLREATVLLEGIEAQEHLFGGALPFALAEVETMDLAGCLPARTDELTLSSVLLTSLANKLLDGDFLPEPVPASRLPEVLSLVATDGRLDPALREGTVQWLETLIPDSGAFGHYCLDRWQEEFCALRPEAIDPRFVRGVIVRLDK